jgi:hypothetical protein
MGPVINNIEISTKSDDICSAGISWPLIAAVTLYDTRPKRGQKKARKKEGGGW